MWLRPKTQLALWVRATALWLVAFIVTLLFSGGFSTTIDPIAIPGVAVFLLLPLALIGTWATADAELPSWSRGRLLLVWIVVPTATVGTGFIAGSLLLPILASQFVGLTMLTGIWATRRAEQRGLLASKL